MNKKLSFTYKTLRTLGFNYSEEAYGQVSLWGVVCKAFSSFWVAFLLDKVMDWWLLAPVLPRKVRPMILRRVGCHVGHGVFIGDHVHIDGSHADLIYIEDGASIAGGSRLLCHQRDFKDYYVGGDYNKLPYRLAEIHIGKGALIGMESMVMPGVTVGEGAIVGACSLVTKDIPAWSVAIGRPAVVIKTIKRFQDNV